MAAWRPSRAEGGGDVALPGSYRIRISGKQPGSTPLLRQLLEAGPGRTSMRRWGARSPGFGSPSGIEWAAGVTHDALEPGQDWRAGSMDFKAAADLMPITLAYHRPMGQARAEGSVEIRAVSLIEKQPNR